MRVDSKETRWVSVPVDIGSVGDINLARSSWNTVHVSVPVGIGSVGDKESDNLCLQV